MKIVKQSLLFGSGFAGGLLTGFFISAWRDEDKFREQSERLEKALARISQATRHTLKEGNERFREINNRLKKEFTRPVPDLYRATESLFLDEDELIYD